MTKWKQRCRKKSTLNSAAHIELRQEFIYFKQKSRISCGGFQKWLHSSLAFVAVRRIQIDFTALNFYIIHWQNHYLVILFMCIEKTRTRNGRRCMINTGAE